jgi:hypothetical protein
MASKASGVKVGGVRMTTTCDGGAFGLFDLIE